MSDLVGLIGSVAAIFTAIFTGMVAIIEVGRQRGGIRVEWKPQLVQGEGLRVSFTILNTTRRAVFAPRLYARGPVRDVFVSHEGRRFDKPGGWPPGKAWLIGDVRPQERQTFTVHVALDVAAARAKSRSLRARTRRLLARGLWRLGYRLRAGVPIRLDLRVFPSPDAMRARRFVWTLRVDDGVIEGEDAAPPPAPQK